jgi:hypothetical protein
MNIDRAVLKQLDADVERAKTTILQNLPTVEKIAPSVVLKLGGAEQTMNKARSDINMGIDTINRTTTTINKLADTVVRTSEALKENIKTEKHTNAVLKKDVKQSETLAQIRKEQAEALKSKYDASRHSSWLGLYRPLADESRYVLLTSGIALLVLFVVSVIYYFWETIRNMIPAIGGESRPYEYYLGGGRKKAALK